MLPAGIDLGCRTSSVAVFDEDRPRAVPDRQGATLRPSTAALARDGSILVGSAVDGLVASLRSSATLSDLDPHLIFEAPKHLGTGWTVQAGSGAPGAVDINAVDLTAALLAEILETSEDTLHTHLGRHVYAIPLAAGEAYRRDLRALATKCFADVNRLVSSTAAAAVFHAARDPSPCHCLVIDAGVGSLGASMIEIEEDGIVLVDSVHGSSAAGGDTWREAINRHLRQQVWDARQADLFGDPMADHKLTLLADEALTALINSESHHLDVTGVDPRCIGLSVKITRSDVADLAAGPLQTTQEIIEQVQADFDKPTLVLLSGGLSRLPGFRGLVQRLVPGATIRSLPAESAALGAAIQSAVLSGTVKDMLLIDATSQGIGVVVNGGTVEPLLPTGTSLPTKGSIELIARAGDPLIVQLVEGDSTWAHDTTALAQHQLSATADSDSSPRRAQLTVELDANYYIHVETTDLDDGSTTTIPIDPKPFQPMHHLRRYPYAYNHSA